MGSKQGEVRWVADDGVELAGLNKFRFQCLLLEGLGERNARTHLRHRSFVVRGSWVLIRPVS